MAIEDKEELENPSLALPNYDFYSSLNITHLDPESIIS